jgi:hypothetical protein
MAKLRLREGILGGIAAGIVMAMVAMMYALVAEGDLLAPVKQMGALFFPNDSGSAISVAAGLMLHMMAGAAFGAIFVLLVRGVAGGTLGERPGFWPVAFAGMVFIVVEWAIASFGLLPLIDRPLLPTFASVGGFVAHLMYGVVLAWWIAARSENATQIAHVGTHRHRTA